MPSTRWSHCGAEDLDVLQTIFWSAGASRNALAQRLAYSKSKANAMVAALIDDQPLASWNLWSKFILPSTRSAASRVAASTLLMSRL